MSELSDEKKQKDSQGAQSVSATAGGDVPPPPGGKNAEAGSDESENDEIAEALRDKEQFKKLAQRAQADLVNYRRRIESEQNSIRLRNQKRIVLRFAEVVDQLEVALNSESSKNTDTGWLEGIEAIHGNFMSALAAEGFERFSSIGEEFDPRKHEALISNPSADHEPNTIISELRAGYLRNNEVVRPAQVEIAVAPVNKSE